MKSGGSIKPGFVLVLLLSGVAGRGTFAENAPIGESCFARGDTSISVGGGYMFSPFLVTHKRPPVNYALTEVRLGYMLTDPTGPGWLRGNVESGLKILGGTILKGEGNYLAGIGPWVRYNFVPKRSRLTPFVQISAGVIQTDMDRRMQGQSFNFDLEGSVGLRYSLSRQSALSLECRYQHISNANMSDPNLGINAVGPMLAFTFAF